LGQTGVLSSGHVKRPERAAAVPATETRRVRNTKINDHLICRVSEGRTCCLENGKSGYVSAPSCRHEGQKLSCGSGVQKEACRSADGKGRLHLIWESELTRTTEGKYVYD